MVTTISLKCEKCGKDFEKKKAEHNRCLKKGFTNSYCSRECSISSTFYKGRPQTNPDWKKHLVPGYDRSDEFTPFRYYYKTCGRGKYRKDDKKNRNVTLEHLKEIWESQSGICPFTGKKMVLKTHATCSEELTPYHASVDRIDHDLGYVVGNIRFISVMANYARNNFSDEQLIEFCKRVRKFRMLG